MKARARGWTACLAGSGAERRVVLVQPGDPLRGPFVASDSDETVACLAVHACTAAAPDRTRVPLADTPAGQRRLARRALGEVRERGEGRAS